MAYKNIVFVKLEKRLLNDHRWWTMSDYSQLFYIKLMLLAAENYNKIPLNDDVLRKSLRCSLPLKDFQRCLNEISLNFPKFKKNKHFRYFKNFEEKTNWYQNKQSLSNRSAIAQLHADKEKEKDKDKEKEPAIATRPSLDDLKTFFKNQDLANSFFDYYSANGWKVGRNSMKDWKAAARNWQRRQGEFSKNGTPKKQIDLWKCFVCEKQMSENQRRAHMDDHEKEVANRG